MRRTGKRRLRDFVRHVEDAGDGRGAVALRTGLVPAERRGRVSPERSLRSSSPGERCSTLGHARAAGCASSLSFDGESGPRSSTALRVRDGPSSFLRRVYREKPDSDSDYRRGFGATGGFSADHSRRCGAVTANAADRRRRFWMPLSLAAWCLTRNSVSTRLFRRRLHRSARVLTQAHP